MLDSVPCGKEDSAHSPGSLVPMEGFASCTHSPLLFSPTVTKQSGLSVRILSFGSSSPKLYSKWGNICSSWREGFQEDTSAKTVVTKGRRERLKCFSGRKGNFSSSFRAGSDGVLLLESAAGIYSRAAEDLSNPVDPHLRQESAHRTGRGLGGIC